MDFHALPRRDLQALCKRNGVRANMTNAAMADALGALPAVDGIEEYVKQPAALPVTAAKSPVKAVAEEEPREKKGSPEQRGRRVTFKSCEPTRQEGGEKEVEEDLKRDGEKDNAPALGVGRRGSSRRARAEAVVAPATRGRAAASKTEAGGDVAADAVPAPTTRKRSQRTVAVVAEEKVPRAGRATRRAAATATKTGMQQEEQELGSQGVVSDVEITVPAPVSDEGRDFPEHVEEAMNPQNEVVEESSQEGEGVAMDILKPVGEESLVAGECTGKSAVQEQQCAAPLSTQEDEGESCDSVMDTPSVEEEAAVAEECTDKPAVQEQQVDVQQCAVPLPTQEDEGESCDSGVVMDTPSVEEEPAVAEEYTDKAAVQEQQVDVQQCAVPLPTQEDEGVSCDSGVVMDTPSVEEEPAVAEECTDKPAVQEQQVDVQQCAVPLPTQEDEAETGEVMIIGTLTPVEEQPVAEECMDKSAVRERQVDVQQCAFPSQEDSTIILGLVEQEGGAPFLDGTGSSEEPLEEEIHHSSEETEMALTSGEATEEVGFTGDGDHAREGVDKAATFGEVLDEASKEDCFLFEEMEDVAVDEVLHDTVTCEETIHLGFSGNISPAVEEDGVVSTDKMPQRSATMDETKESATVDNVPQVNVTNDEEAGDTARDCSDHITSPLCAGMSEDVTKSQSINSIAVEPTVSELVEDVSLCMDNNSSEKSSTEPVEVEQEKEIKESKKSAALDQLSLGKLKTMLKETLIARKNKKRVALGRLDENVGIPRNQPAADHKKLQHYSPV